MSAEKKKKSPVIVLLSGGIDSAACVNYYLQNGFSPKGLFVDYGQLVKKKEYESAKKIASYYKINLDTIKVNTSNKFGKGEIKGRNAFFVITALMKFKNFSGLMALGIHSGTQYFDTTEQFISNMNSLLSGYTNGTVRLDAPFVKWQKFLIYEYCKDNNVPIRLTYSCEQGERKPCGVCNSCLDRKALGAYAGKK